MEIQEPNSNKTNDNVLQKPNKKSVKIVCFFVNTSVANIFFAILSISGQVGMKVSLPLWIDSTLLTRSERLSNGSRTNASNQTNPNGDSEAYIPEVDAYFVLSFSTILFFVIMGISLLFIWVFQPNQLGKTERNFPHSQLILPGFFNALNGFFIVFASSGTRTAPYLQAILSNIMIPLIIGLRYFVLHKVPTRRQFLCAMIILVSLFICLIPKIFTSIDPKADKAGGASGVAGILWPVCFMFASVPSAAFLLKVERNLQVNGDETETPKGQVHMVFYLFWMHFYQLLVILAMFWADFVPGFGYADNIHDFWENWWFGIKCFFGGSGCDSKCGIRGTVFVIMYLMGYVGTVNLARFSEGATFIAVVNATVTPLGFLFWTLFRESPFGFHPAVQIATWFSIGALIPMVPAIFMYTLLAQKRTT